ISTTTASGRCRRISRSSARPSMPAMRTSEKTTSNSARPSAASAAGPSATASAVWPRPWTYVVRCVRMFFSSSTMRMDAMSATRQLEREPAPDADRAVEVDAPAVRLDDVAHDGEAETGRADVAALAGLDEAVEDAFLLIGRDPAAGVADRDDDGPVRRRGLDAHRAAGGRVAERVREQVGERPGELRGIARDREAPGGDGGFQRDAFFPRLQDEQLQRAWDHVPEIDVPPLDRNARGARPREVEQPLGEVLEPLHVLVRRADERTRSGANATVAAEELDRHAE